MFSSIYECNDCRDIMSGRYSCSHMATVSNIPIQEIVKAKEKSTCSDCPCYGPNLWICLYHDCLQIGCSEKFNDHSTLHNRNCPAHCIHMNLSTQRIWCYICQTEVFMDGKSKQHLRSVVYSDSDNEIDESRPYDRDSYDSGRGSYTTLRTDSLERRTSRSTVSNASETNQVFAFDKTVGLNVGMSGDSAADTSDTDDDANSANRTRGLVGLQNIGNTCYMNAAIQALSNTPPLTAYFLDCAGAIKLASEGRKPGISRSYQRLVKDMWHRKTRGYVVPSGILYGIRNVHSMFRGYHQHDTQEFLRCFMDQLHEELKLAEAPTIEHHAICTTSTTNIERQSTGSCDTLDSYSLADANINNNINDGQFLYNHNSNNNYEQSIIEGNSGSTSQSEGEYETCDSGVSERSSLSDDTERSSDHNRRRSSSSTAKRRLSRSGSPGRTARLRSKLTSVSYPVNSVVVEQQPGVVNSTTSTTTTTTTATATTSTSSGTTSTTTNMSDKNKKQIKYRSIISDVFDGKLLSSVQCLTCDRISTRIETFQDLSLPIPNRDHLAVLHGTGLTKTISNNNSGSSSGATADGGSTLTCTEAVYPGGNQDGWVAWLWTWLKSWFYGPTVGLHDCLAAFFSADELKGDNMYSCEKCNKLRNGVKFSKVIDLPEVLCIHLKRFRHELMFSSKISSQVSFPLNGLDMRPYLHKDCISNVSGYDLISVICHHGTAGGGHYTCYSLNAHSDHWYEFDDQYVTRVTADTVLGCEAYVLFYRKSNQAMLKCRTKAYQLMDATTTELSEMKFYISRQWISKFATFAEPGPIDNSDFLCQHGGLKPDLLQHIDQLTTIVAQTVWEYLYETFGGGPACNHLYECPICEQAAEAFNKRITMEMDTFMLLHREFQNMDSLSPTQSTSSSSSTTTQSTAQSTTTQLTTTQSTTTVYAMSMNWFRQWQSFVRTRTSDPPGPIDNSNIVNQPTQPGQPETVKPGSDYSQISEELWQFFHSIYGGGPEIKLRTASIHHNNHNNNNNNAKVVVTLPPQRSQSVNIIQQQQQQDNNDTNNIIPEFYIPRLKAKKYMSQQNFDIVPQVHGNNDTITIQTEPDVLVETNDDEIMITEQPLQQQQQQQHQQHDDNHNDEATIDDDTDETKVINVYKRNINIKDNKCLLRKSDYCESKKGKRVK